MEGWVAVWPGSGQLVLARACIGSWSGHDHTKLPDMRCTGGRRVCRGGTCRPPASVVPASVHTWSPVGSRRNSNSYLPTIPTYNSYLQFLITTNVVPLLRLEAHRSLCRKVVWRALCNLKFPSATPQGRGPVRSGGALSWMAAHAHRLPSHHGQVSCRIHKKSGERTMRQALRQDLLGDCFPYPYGQHHLLIHHLARRRAPFLLGTRTAILPS